MIGIVTWGEERRSKDKIDKKVDGDHRMIFDISNRMKSYIFKINIERPYIASSRHLCSTNMNVTWPLVPVVCVRGLRGYSTDIRVLAPYRTDSRPSCSTSGNKVSPLAPGHSWLLVCLDRSRLMEPMLLRMLLDKQTKPTIILKFILIH